MFYHLTKTIMKTVFDVLMTMVCLSLCFTHDIWAQEDYSAGYSAGSSITMGTKNTLIGFKAGQKTTTGSENTFLGRGAGLNNKKGSHNIFLGVDAGYNNIEGSGNIFLGNEAGRFSETSGAIFIGHGAGWSHKSGWDNIFIGNSAGSGVEEGYHNIFIGQETGYQLSSGEDNILMGWESGYFMTEGDRNLMIGTMTGRVNNGSDNTFLGFFAGAHISKGNENTFVGAHAGGFGNKSTAIGYRAVAEAENSTAIGYRAVVTASNALVLGSVKGVNHAEANTNVGIGIIAPKYQLHLSTNSAAKPGSSAWKVASDKRLKQDIAGFTDGLEVINQIKPIKYRYNGKAGLPQDKEYIGVVAQEIQEVAPYMVNTFTYQDTTGTEEEYLDFDATALTYLLINAIKEQQQKITELENKLNALEQNSKSSSSNPSSVMLGHSNSRLEQNVPNPYTSSTEIGYRVPENAHSAFIKVYGIGGKQIEIFDISGQSEGKVILSSGAIPMGTYVYQLWVDGQLKDSKKLIQTQ
jgi:trimeric autotransporter adhesin